MSSTVCLHLFISTEELFFINMVKSNQLEIITSLRVTLARLDGIPTLAHGNEEIITSLRVTLARLDGIPTLAHGNEEKFFYSL